MTPKTTPSLPAKSSGLLNNKKSPQFWRHFLASCMLLCAAVLPNMSKAQTPLTVGSAGTTNTYYPIYTFYGYNYSQSTYLASEIVAAGAGAGTPGYISSISYNASTYYSGFTSLCPDWKVYMGNTTKSTFSGTTDWVALSSLTKVFDGTAVCTGTGWFKITFPTPFYWDGVSNLVVAVDENTPGYTSTMNWVSTSRTGTRSISYYSDGTNPDPASPPTANTSAALTPDIKIDYTPATPCSGTTVGGTTVASATSICPGNTVALSTTGSTVGTGMTWQWESAPAATGPWTAISGATSTTYVATPASGTTTYFRRQTTCTSTSSSAYSTGVAVSVSTATSVPYTETFETGTAGVNMPCAAGVPSFTTSALYYGSTGDFWKLLSGAYAGTGGDNHTAGGSKYIIAGYNIGAYSGSVPGYWYTPGINLTSGKTYRFSYWYRVSDYMATYYPAGADFGMYYNRAQSATGAVAIKPDLAGKSSNVYAQSSGDFSVPTSAVYYLGVKIDNKGYGYYGGGLFDDLNLIELPNCNTATASTFGSGGKASASPNVICSTPGATTLSLTSTPPFSGLSFSWEMASGTPTSFSATGGTTASYAYTISTGGVYFFRCKVTCTATGLSSYSDTTKVTTTPITPPYIEDFEGGTPGVNLPCASYTYSWGSPGTYWTLSGSPFSASYPAINNHTVGGSKYLHPGYYIGTYGSGAPQWWFTPGLALTSGKAYEVSFWFNGSGYSGGNTAVGVGYGASQTAAAMISTGLDTNINTTTYLQIKRNFIATSTSTFYVGLKVNHTVYSYPGAAIDDIGVNQLPPCAAKPSAGKATASPAVLCTSSSTSSIALLGVSAASDLQFQWESSPSGAAGSWTAIAGATAPAYVTTTPAAMKWYRCIVTCPLISAPNVDTSLPVQVKTTPITPPYYEDFESGTMGVNMPCAANTSSWAATTYWYLRDGDFSVSYPTIKNHTVGGSKYIHAGYALGSYSSGATEYWFTPALALTASKAYKVSYWFNGSGYSGGNTLTGVAVGTAQTAAAMTMTAGADTIVNLSSYRQINRSFISPTTGNYFVGIKVNNLVYSYPGVAIDDIGVDQLPPCSGKPSAGMAVCSPTMICATGTAVLSIPSASMASDLTFQWYDVTAGLPGTAIAGATGVTYTTPTLSTTKKYRCVVTCPLSASPNTDTSGTVTVNVGAITPPYSENFETAGIGVNVPCAAVTSTFTATSRWYMYASAFSPSYPAIINHTAGGSKYLYAGYTLGSYSLGANQFWFTPALKFTAGSTYEFSYWYSGSGYAGGKTNLGMYYGTAQTAAGMTTAIIPDKVAVNTGTYKQLTGRFIAPTTANYYIGVKVNHTVYSYPGIAIDDIGFDQLPNCTGAPSVGSVESTPSLLCAAGTAVLDMDLGGVSKVAGLTYKWYSSPLPTSGFTEMFATALTSPTYTTPTISATTYFRCVVKCSLTGDSTISSVIKLDVGAITPPYIQTFETVTPGSNAPCASNTSTFGSTTYWTTLGAPMSTSYPTMDNHTAGGSNYLCAGYYLGTYGLGAAQYWFTPAIKFTGGSLYQLNFWYNGSGYAGGSADIAAFYGTAQTAAAMTTAIGSPLVSVNTSTYKEFVQKFTPSTSGNFYIGIQMNHKVYSYPGIAIDDIGVQAVPPCSAPVVAGTIFADPIQVCAVGGTTVLDLKGSTLATGLTYEWLSSTSAAGPFLSTSGTTVPYTTDPLSAATWFKVAVKCTASGATDTSAAFKVGVGGFDLPYIEDFESTAGGQKPLCSDATAWGMYYYDAWTVYTGTYTGAYGNHTPGGKKHLIAGYYLGYSTYSPTYTTVTDDNYWFTPGLNMRSGYKYNLQFWYIGTGSGYPNGNRMGVFFGKSQTVGGMTGTIIPFAVYKNTSYELRDTSFKVPTSGIYYLGFKKSNSTAMGTSAGLSAYGVAFDDINLNYAPCDAMPSAGTVSSSVSSGTAKCIGTRMTLTNIGSTVGLVPGIKFQWQRKGLGATAPFTWTAVAGAKDTVLSADTLIGYEYRLAVVCTNTNDSAFSPAFQLPALPPHPPVSISPSSTPVTYCLGDTVKFNATSFTGAVYDWMLDSVTVPGWKFSDMGATEPGTYMVKVTSALSSCPGYSNKVKLVVNDPGYTVNITKPADSILCAGSSILLTATSSKSGVTYQWRKNNVNIPGATSATYLVTTGGYYRVMASDGVSTCAAASRNILMTVKPNPPAVLSVPGGTTTACENEGVLLKANVGGYSYEWMRTGSTIVGWTDSSQLVKNSGTYSVKVRSSDGCVSTSSSVTVNILPSPIPVITRTGFTLSTTVSFPGGYQWIRNGSDIAGATSSTYTLLYKGLYKVRVKDANGCEGESAPIEAQDDELGISTNTVVTDQIRIYPNPTQSKVFIESPVAVKVSVKDVTGKTVYESQETKEVDLGKFADGVYLFMISDKSGNELMKQQRVTKFTNK